MERIPSTHLIWWRLGNEQGSKFREPSVVQSAVPLASVAAVGGVGAEDVAVAGFEHFIDAGFVNGTGSYVVGQCSEEDAIFPHVAVDRTELQEVFAKKCIGFTLAHFVTTEILLSR